MFAVDTNIFLYAHFEQFSQHKKARIFCKDLLTNTKPWCMGWQVYYEYLRITTHSRILLRPLSINDALADLQPYLELDTLYILSHTAQHRQISSDLFSQIKSAKGNFIHDCHYAALLKEYGVKILYTADMDFKKFNFLEVIDPTV